MKRWYLREGWRRNRWKWRGIDQSKNRRGRPRRWRSH